MYLFIGCIFVLVGCTEISNPRLDGDAMDISYLTESPCAPPCWQGFVLNEPAGDVYSLLEGLPFVITDTIKTIQYDDFNGFPDATEVNYQCKESRGNLCGFVILSDGLLISTYHSIYYDLPLSVIIEKHGPPAEVLFTPASPHGDGCIVVIEYRDQNIEIGIIDSYNESLCKDLIDGKAFDPNIGVTFIIYQVPEAFTPDRCQKGGCVPWPGLRQ